VSVADDALREIDSLDAAPLDDVAAFICQFVTLTAFQADAIALWVAMTYISDRFSFAAYLLITSAEKRCGKSRLLEVLKLLVPRPLFTARISVAALVRSLDAEKRVLLLDEFDAAVRGDREIAEALRGALDAGFHCDGTHTITVGKDFKVKQFRVYGPKAIATIRDLPDTVADRGIPIVMERKATGERVRRLRERYVKEPAAALRQRLEAWTNGVADEAAVAEPDLPDELDDRAQDIVEPLVAIADCAGGDWPQQARTALRTLFQAKADTSRTTILLRDIRGVFVEMDAQRIPSAYLVGRLTSIESSPWGNPQNPLNVHQLAKMLAPFSIAPHVKRDGKKTFRGYERAQFERVWERYLSGPQADRNNVTKPTTTDFVTVNEPLQDDAPLQAVKRNKLGPDDVCNAVTVSHGLDDDEEINLLSYAVRWLSLPAPKSPE